jgi:UDP-2,3-diacylglucosamine hydrolase
MRDTIYFISDQHLGRERNEEKKIEKLFSFFDYIASRASALYIVGDFFDFYFEYRTQIPKKYYEVFKRLSYLIERRIQVHYFTGNHDFWLGSFFRSIGISVHKSAENVLLQGKRLYIAHGSGMISFDPVNLVLRSRTAIGLFYLLHPDLAYKIASFVSKISRMNSKKKNIRWKKLYNIARDILKGDVDAVILGHIHIPIHRKLDGKDFILLGDWIEHFSYAVMKNGDLSLHNW